MRRGRCAAAARAAATPWGGPVVTLPAVINGRIAVSLLEFPALQAVGGGVVGRPEGLHDPIAISRTDQGTFQAVSAFCTHMACILRYNQLNATLDCPCHGSSFELDGAVVSGPAVKPLRVLTTDFDGNVVGVLTG